ncbi:hypothetical protein QTI05_22720 [Variovorax sp. J22R193]|uniref:hypothetical protein n=1 Tax=Variovorax fucosicus TaxID=3053517 RepID=UPI00257690E5|nr:hypothetical protein [Variovorax sp. J22R193]MDM0041872.1 hypothetical protein [Variovorax sp. J22R193]
MSIDLNAPEVQKAIKDAVTSAVEEATTGLVSKRDELLREVKELRKGKTINPEDVTKLEDQIEALKGQVTEAQKAAKTATSQAEKDRKALETAEGFTQRLLVDNGLNDALAKAGVTNPVHLKAVKSMLAGQVQVATEGDQRVAKVGDKALADYVAEWSKGDEGKHFVAAPANSGGGAGGGGGSSNAQKGDLGGNKDERLKAIESRFPNLTTQ